MAAARKESGPARRSRGARLVSNHRSGTDRAGDSGLTSSTERTKARVVAPPMPPIDPAKSLREWKAFFASCPKRTSHNGRKGARR